MAQAPTNQTSASKPTTPPQGATTSPAPRLSDTKPADPKPADAGASNTTAAGAANGTTDSSEDTRKKRESKRKVFVVVGEVKEFDSIAQAEKYLNSDEAPKDYTVLQGTRARKSTKVSLR